MQSPSRQCWPKQTKNIVILLFLAEIIITQTDLNYLIPREFVRRVQLSPLVVILGIVTEAVLAGELGVVLAAPALQRRAFSDVTSIRVCLKWIRFPIRPLPAPVFRC